MPVKIKRDLARQNRPATRRMPILPVPGVLRWITGSHELSFYMRMTWDGMLFALLTLYQEEPWGLLWLNDVSWTLRLQRPVALWDGFSMIAQYFSCSLHLRARQNVCHFCRQYVQTRLFVCKLCTLIRFSPTFVPKRPKYVLVSNRGQAISEINHVLSTSLLMARHHRT